MTRTLWCQSLKNIALRRIWKTATILMQGDLEHDACMQGDLEHVASDSGSDIMPSSMRAVSCNDPVGS